MPREDAAELRSFMEAFGVRPRRVQRAETRAGEALAAERAKPVRPTRAQRKKEQRVAALRSARRVGRAEEA